MKLPSDPLFVIMSRPSVYNTSDKHKETAGNPTMATANTGGSEKATPGNAKAKAKARATARKKAKRSFKQPNATIGIAVTEELDAAIARCRSKVENISKLCRARNRKFRSVNCAHDRFVI